MSLACRIVGYNSQVNNKLFSKIFTKKLFETMTLGENIKMLQFGFMLSLRVPALERLEIYVVDQFAAEAEQLKENEALLAAYMVTYQSRKKCSQIMIQQAIRFVDIFFDQVREPNTPDKIRLKLRQLLAILEL